MIDECLYCGEDIESDDYQQYCNDYCEDKSDMELLDKLDEENNMNDKPNNDTCPKCNGYGWIKDTTMRGFKYCEHCKRTGKIRKERTQ